MTVDVEVPYDLHGYIIGQKGAGIRKMMEDYEVRCCRSDTDLIIRGECSVFRTGLDAI